MKFKCPVAGCDLFATANGSKDEILRQALAGTVTVFCASHGWRSLSAGTQREIAEDLNPTPKGPCP